MGGLVNTRTGMTKLFIYGIPEWEARSEYVLGEVGGQNILVHILPIYIYFAEKHPRYYLPAQHNCNVTT